MPEKRGLTKSKSFHLRVPRHLNSFGNGVVTTDFTSFNPFRVLKYSGFSNFVSGNCSVNVLIFNMLIVEPVSMRHLILFLPIVILIIGSLDFEATLKNYLLYRIQLLDLCRLPYMWVDLPYLIVAYQHSYVIF